MNPKDRKYLLYLEDILLSMHRIQEYIGVLTLDEFAENYMIVDAVVRNFEIIGEAAKNIPIDVTNKYPDIPWDKMYRLRNIASHQYFGIDIKMIWQIAKNELPKNMKDLARIIEIEKE